MHLHTFGVFLVYFWCIFGHVVVISAAMVPILLLHM